MTLNFLEWVGLVSIIVMLVFAFVAFIIIREKINPRYDELTKEEIARHEWKQK